jgi:hypothetical protein
MFTSGLNKDTTNVIGLINPCHKPNQKPAASGSVPASSFGPAAHAASSNSAPMSGTACMAPGRWMPSRFMALTHSLGDLDLPRTGPDPKTRSPLPWHLKVILCATRLSRKDKRRKQRGCHSPSRAMRIRASPAPPDHRSPVPLALGSPFQCSLAAVLRPEANEASGVGLSSLEVRVKGPRPRWHLAAH